ncbi:hypothetical protein RHP06_25880, partial [Salmonella enterica subsp. enterica serovar Typhimurium]|nr:hypothetical protein [Salmonella enterica subsp. enterica serovar Typhimurium]
MASAALSMPNSSLQVNKGFSEFAGLRSSASLPFNRRTSDDLLSVVAFQTSVIGGGNKRGVVEAKLKVA